ncbi:hypothetical protein SynMITS9220_00899 [Synechococcus sp. MIT S9220]|nr:hypothetical protein SynMITS9220_00899 [Synechococcus sp. MIT S9220]
MRKGSEIEVQRSSNQLQRRGAHGSQDVPRRKIDDQQLINRRVELT